MGAVVWGRWYGGGAMGAVPWGRCYGGGAMGAFSTAFVLHPSTWRLGEVLPPQPWKDLVLADVIGGEEKRGVSAPLSAPTESRVEGSISLKDQRS